MQATLDPFANEASGAVIDGCDKHFETPPRPCQGYTAIAFSNRFDLADKDRGQHCGEFRIVFARNSGFPKVPIKPVN